MLNTVSVVISKEEDSVGGLKDSVWRGIFIYYTYLTFFGTWNNYVAKWAVSEGYDTSDVALAIMLPSLFRLIIDPFFTQYADVTGKRKETAIFLMSLAFFSFLCLRFVNSSPMFILVYFMYVLFVNSAMGISDGIAVRVSYRNGYNFAILRGMGSFAYLIGLNLMGYLIQNYGGYKAIYSFGLKFFIFTMVIYIFFMPKLNDRLMDTKIFPLKILISNSNFVLFLLAAFFVQFTFGFIQVFGFSAYTEFLHLSDQQASFLLSLAQVSEVIVLFFCGFLFRRFNLLKLMIVSVFITLLRWMLVASFTNQYVIAFSQLLQGPGYGVFLIASSQFICKIIPSSFSSSAQGLLMMFGFTLASSCGVLLSGYLYPIYGMQSLYFLSTPIIVALPLLFLVLYRTKDVEEVCK